MSKKVNKIVFHLTDGSSHYTENEKDIDKVLKGCPRDWEGLKKTAATRELHNKYFTMLNRMCKDLSLGYSKATLHDSIKPILFGYLKDQRHLFTTDVYEQSTRNLTSEGYSVLIEALKEVANDIYNYQFQ